MTSIFFLARENENGHKCGYVGRFRAWSLKIREIREIIGKGNLKKSCSAGRQYSTSVRHRIGGGYGLPAAMVPILRMGRAAVMSTDAMTWDGIGESEGVSKNGSSIG
jgi:hypothetical protein